MSTVTQPRSFEIRAKVRVMRKKAIERRISIE